jgi:hypothetical protein
MHVLLLEPTLQHLCMKQQAITKLPLKPDLVLVDGRFRVACVLQALLTVPTARILVHDFWQRPAYHIVLQYTTVLDRADTMVLLQRMPSVDDAAIEAQLKNYLYKWD